MVLRYCLLSSTFYPYKSLMLTVDLHVFFLQRKAEEVKPYLNGRSMYLVGQSLLLFVLASLSISGN